MASLGKAQAEIAEIVRWSRSGDSNYLALRSIDTDAWRMVVDTTKASMVPTGDGDAVSPGDTAVSKQFTVRQLRDIISLPAEQQLSLVNDLGDLGKTQGETSEIMRWSREGAKNYATLRNIAAEAWQIVVGTTKSAFVPSVENGDVPDFGTVVPFTEGLLPTITPLTFEQQLWLVKSLAGLGMTQAEIAEIMQWARTSVANCLALKNICPEAWQIVVVTTKASAVTDGNTEVVTPNATTVTFGEHMLRSITCLTAEQQLWLVKSLVVGKMDKTQFKAIAENANARNGWRTEAARG